MYLFIIFLLQADIEAAACNRPLKCNQTVNDITAGNIYYVSLKK